MPSWSPTPPVVTFDHQGFLITKEGSSDVRGEWADIREIFAYKTDFWSYDEICIGLRFDQSGNHWEVAESCRGYREFLDELARRFPNMRTDWFAEVAYPAFAVNRTTLWTAESTMRRQSK